ncbi:MAG TPA: hypothetical protein VM097_04230 [Mycobacteriales bacterium]|nr:hypothetical protein [Mycobacteriales bacterium]
MHFAVGASAATTTTTTYSSSCFAQLLSVTLAGESIPLDEGRDCSDPGDSFVPVGTIAGPAEFPLVVDVLYESTSRSADQSKARARAGVAHVFLPLSTFGGPDVTLDVLTSESTCKDGVADGSSHVVGLKVGEDQVELPGDITGDTIDLSPVAFIELNKAADSSSSSDTGATSNPRVQTTTDNHEQTALHLVVLPAEEPDPPLLDVVIAHTSASCSKTTTTTTTGGGGGGGGLPAQTGWMNGGGTMVDSSTTTVAPGSKVSHGFVLPCFVNQTPPGGSNLTVNGHFGHFKLSTVDTVKCTDDPNQGDPQNPKATFNTMDGTGTGVCNGAPAKATWHFTDEGEPNTADEAKLEIHSTGSPSVCDLVVTGLLTHGNNQAHPLPTTGGSSVKAKGGSRS